jgi:hypothetical protein
MSLKMGSRRISRNALRVVLCFRNVLNKKEILQENKRVFRREERYAFDASLSAYESERERGRKERGRREEREADE